MNLSTFAVVLVFAGEVFALELIQDFGDGFSRFGEHGLERHPRLQLAVLT